MTRDRTAILVGDDTVIYAPVAAADVAEMVDGHTGGTVVMFAEGPAIVAKHIRAFWPVAADGPVGLARVERMVTPECQPFGYTQGAPA